MSAPTELIQDYQVRPRVAIYALRDPRTREVRYIGKAVDPRRRLQQHLTSFQLTYYRSKKVSWLKSLRDAGEQPILVILQVVDADDANRAERQWIAQYRADGARLTNGTEGGDGGAITDPDAKARIRAAHVGRVCSDETKKKMSASHKALVTPEERERLRSISNGKPPVHPGEKNPRTKLSDAQVKEIRVRANAGAVLADLASEYGITPASVTQLVTGKTRAAAGGPIRVAKARMVLNDENVELIRRLYGEGRTQVELARRFGVSQGHISALVAGKKRPIRPGNGGF